MWLEAPRLRLSAQAEEQLLAMLVFVPGDCGGSSFWLRDAPTSAVSGVCDLGDCYEDY